MFALFAHEFFDCGQISTHAAYTQRDDGQVGKQANPRDGVGGNEIDDSLHVFLLDIKEAPYSTLARRRWASVCIFSRLYSCVIRKLKSNVKVTTESTSVTTICGGKAPGVVTAAGCKPRHQLTAS